MKFNEFFITLLGVVFIGISIGYILGFYAQKFFEEDSLFYLSVLFMGIGCFVSIYGSMFYKK
tara:strand:- start:62 stop:247 length:186 start_codon:yes stop_codon:yes gene_type:complete